MALCHTWYWRIGNVGLTSKCCFWAQLRTISLLLNQDCGCPCLLVMHNARVRAFHFRLELFSSFFSSFFDGRPYLALRNGICEACCSFLQFWLVHLLCRGIVPYSIVINAVVEWLFMARWRAWNGINSAVLLAFAHQWHCARMYAQRMARVPLLVRLYCWKQ